MLTGICDRICIKCGGSAEKVITGNGEEKYVCAQCGLNNGYVETRAPTFIEKIFKL